MGRDGAAVAVVAAGLVWEVVEEDCFGIEVVVEAGCRVGDWNLNRVVVEVDVEGLIACVAVVRRGFELPVSMGLGVSFGMRSWESEIYLFWFRVSEIKGFSTRYEYVDGVKTQDSATHAGSASGLEPLL